MKILNYFEQKKVLTTTTTTTTCKTKCILSENSKTTKITNRLYKYVETLLFLLKLFFYFYAT